MNDKHSPAGRGVRMVAMEAAVAVILFAFGALVVFDSFRMGASWGDDGPQSGYFPFYIGLIICLASAGTLWQRVLGPGRDIHALFVEKKQIRPVLSVLLPALAYVGAIQLVGIYVSSALYIALFMMVFGRYSWIKAGAVALGTSVVVFCMFEVWFKVPLYKGLWDPIAFLGY